MKEEYVVYILELNDGSLYTGITNNIIRRIKQHSSGKGSKYVSSRLPIIKTYIINKKLNKSEALKLEHKIKKTDKSKKLDKLLGVNNE